MIKVSVIIPTYNREKYVVKALDSVLAQTFKDYEIILIDDGSNDKTRQVLESYQGKIRYIYQENSGVSAARNAGVRIARGEWLAFLDSDDEWNPAYLSLQMDRAKEIPAAVIHVTNSILIENDGIRINTFESIGLSAKLNNIRGLVINDPLEFVIKYHITHLPCIIISRKIILAIGMFEKTMNIAEDTDLIIRVALKGALGVWNEPLVYFYRRDENIVSLSSCGFVKIRENLIQLTERILENEKLSVTQRKTLIKALSGHYRSVGNFMIETGCRKTARDYFKKGLIKYKSIWNILKYVSSFGPIELSRSIIRK